MGDPAPLQPLYLRRPDPHLTGPPVAPSLPAVKAVLCEWCHEARRVPYRLEPMTLRDIPEVIEIERLSFSMTWPANSYKRELSRTGWPATSSLATSRGPASPPAGPPEGVPAPLSALLLPQTAERSSPDVSPARRSSATGACG